MKPFVEYIAPLLLGAGLGAWVIVLFQKGAEGTLPVAVIGVGLFISYGLCEIARNP
jgi:uncharacterized membrane protein